jgi:O-acetyl-ADP-ribose deacetylase (regulator of RNase III)
MKIYIYAVVVISLYAPSGMAMSALRNKQGQVATQAPSHQDVKKNLEGLSEYKSYQFGNTTVTVAKGDITKVRVDAIVNAANAGLWRGGGVCGAIFSAAGKRNLENEVAKLKDLPSEEERVGQAFVTPIPDKDESNNPTIKKTYGVKYVVHAVGPNCTVASENKVWKEKLGAAYSNSLKEANKMGDVESIAFPAISTAIFACPINDATPVALDAIIATAPETKIKHVLCMFLPNDTSGGYKLYTAYLDKKAAEKK